MKLSFISAIVLAFWLGITPPATAAHPYNPQFKPVSQVYDYANVLRQKTLQDLKAYAEDSEYYTGTQLVVAVVQSFGGRTADDYADEAAKSLKLSEQGKPGVLLIVSKDDRNARIVAASQLGSGLPLSVQKAIVDHIVVPNLQQGKFERGVIDGVGAIMMAMQGKYTPQVPQMQSAFGKGKTGWSPMAIIGVLVLLKLAGFGRRRNYYGGYGGGGSITGSIIGGIIGSLLMGGARRNW